MKTKKKYKKFFVIQDDELTVTDLKYFDTINSWDEAILVGLNCFLGIQKTLKKDALDDCDSFVGTLKVTKGLDRSLEELDSRFPHLLNYIHLMNLKFDGTKIIYC